MLPVITILDVTIRRRPTWSVSDIEQTVFLQFTSTASFDAYDFTVSAMLEKEAETRQQQQLPAYGGQPGAGGMPPQGNFGHGMSQQPPLGYRYVIQFRIQATTSLAKHRSDPKVVSFADIFPPFTAKL